MKVTGAKEILAALERYKKSASGALGAALYQEGLDIDAKAVCQMPVDTTRMRSTHYVTPPQDTIQGPVVELGVGTDYAVYAHERTDVHHRVGDAKFYEIPLNECRAGYAERIRDRTASNITRGVTMVPAAAPTRPEFTRKK